MKKLSIISFFLILLFLVGVWGCNCKNEPVIPQFEGRFYVVLDTIASNCNEAKLSFSQPVDPNTVIYDSNDVEIYTLISMNATINDTVWSQDLMTLTLIIIPDSNDCEKLPISGKKICEPRFTLKSMDNISIGSALGKRLDGDNDGSEGGDFERSFTCILDL